MDKILERNKCNGCSACVHKCPKSAIKMETDELGFLYPVIDQKKCIDCGLCKKVCPVLNEKLNTATPIAYALFNKDERIRLNSSSGGFFTILATHVIKNKGVVYGASFDNHNLVRHIRINSIKDIEKLRGSKYLQSDINNVFKTVLKDLKNDKLVLFTGTPCQIGGLKSFLKKDYDNLITQDIICHGVPSPKLWLKYLDEKIKGKVEKINFRNKDNGWGDFNLYIKSNKEEYSKSHCINKYMQLFLKNMCLRNSCYDCAFKNSPKISDITLGDLWGANELVGKFNDDLGLSFIIVNSEKGKKIFALLKEETDYKEINFEKAVKHNSAYFKSVEKPVIRKDMEKDINNLSFDKICKKYVPEESKVKKILRKIKNFLRRIKHKIWR